MITSANLALYLGDLFHIMRLLFALTSKFHLNLLYHQIFTLEQVFKACQSGF